MATTPKATPTKRQRGDKKAAGAGRRSEAMLTPSVAAAVREIRYRPPRGRRDPPQGRRMVGTDRRTLSGKIKECAIPL